MSNQTLNLNDTTYDYYRKVAYREPSILTELRQETAKLDQAMMQIAPEQGQFMATLTQLMGARRYLEVGTFTGYSALAVALVLPDDGQIVACDISDEWTAIGRGYWQKAQVAHKIDLRLGPAVDTLAKMIEDGQRETFDVAFIDADKPSYDRYYESSLTLVRPGGVILVDNVLWSGSVADQSNQTDATRALRALNTKIHADERVDVCMLPIGDGLTMARKR